MNTASFFQNRELVREAILRAIDRDDHWPDPVTELDELEAYIAALPMVGNTERQALFDYGNELLATIYPEDCRIVRYFDADDREWFGVEFPHGEGEWEDGIYGFSSPDGAADAIKTARIQALSHDGFRRLVEIGPGRRRLA